MKSLPLALKHAIETGQCVLFLGAGIGHHLKDAKGELAPLAVDLAEELVNHFDIKTDNRDLAKVAQAVVHKNNNNRAELEHYLRQRLANLEPDESLQWLFTLRWKAIFTTNYDYGIERCYELLSNPQQNPIIFTMSSDLTDYDPRFQVPIYHLHGTLFNVEHAQIVITRDDYLRFREKRRMMFDILKKEFATATFLYIGYSNLDPNWNLILDEMSEDFFPSTLPRSFRVAPVTDELDLDYLSSKNIETITSSYLDFYASAAASLKIVELGSGLLEIIRKTVPLDLLPEFEKNPAPVTRLLNNWTYVNEAPFDEHINLYQFLRGDHPNWALIASKQIFERDVEEDFFHQLLDYATSSSKRPFVTIMLAPAGYGTTTLLMTIAVRLIVAKAGSVFMLKSQNQKVSEGDIEFVLSIKDENVFFFIDNAADSSAALSTVVDRLSNTGRKAIFVLGERTNEWRQRRYKPVGREFSIDVLSDPEIHRLIDYLTTVSALNKLADLERSVQFAAIKERQGKQLLVVMREATEGKSFDAILEDEYRGIHNSVAQRCYLIVSFFHQYGTYVRASLLADMLRLTLVTLFDEIADALEGVVNFDVIDEARNIQGARTRHRTIAEVVWVRTSVAGDNEDIIHESLARLNLNYRTDKEAFEQFVRSEKMIDAIRTFDGRTRFFEAAIRKDPDSPYVKQHYARMLLRAGHTNLALTQIESAISQDRKARVLYHTKGIILAKMATATDVTLEMGRRYLVQSESAFRSALKLYPADEYSFHGMAELFFNWAKCAPTEAEKIDYISKAEDTITEGFKKVRDRENLWILSSQISDWLGNEPKHLSALIKAVEANPAGIRARHLLGRAYRELGKGQDAINVLDPIIKSHFDEFRSFVEYSLALLAIGRPYREAIGILNQSTLYGYGDPRFIATLGGMLFMISNFTEADKVFSESTKRNFTYTELAKVQFQPPDPNNLASKLRLVGKVVTVRAGNSLIEHQLFGQFICNSSKYDGLFMEKGLTVSFEPAFSAMGVTAIKPRRGTK